MLKPLMVALLLTTPTAVLAGGFTPMELAKHIFKTTDADGDGKMTRAEHDASNLPRYGSQFEKLDVNENDVVTLEEYVAVFLRHHRSPAEEEA